jgi:tetratricopeptide (TPR) repeat protein
MSASDDTLRESAWRLLPWALGHRRQARLAASVIVLAGLVVYAGTFSVPFLFDDTPSILDNASLQNLKDAVLHPPSGYGVSVSGRPVLNFSLAINHALSGTKVWSYHALNLAIHLLAGLTLFGIVRRTLMGPVGAQACCAQAQGRDEIAPLQASATFLALTVALLWTVHPLQTEAVTYIIQRSESLMGLFFLLVFYCFIRSIGSPRPGLWQVGAVAACLLGAATKEVMVVAPVLIFLYDRTFVAGSFRAAWQQHRWAHLGLFATWVPLGWVVAATGNRGGTAGFDVGVAPWSYWLTQAQAIAYYLKLSVWPHPLVFEYGTFWSRLSDAAPYALVVVPLAASTLIALWRWPTIGFLGAWFFAILAPTSLVPGTIQMIVEHRMYLPLAAVIASLVFGSHASWQWATNRRPLTVNDGPGDHRNPTINRPVVLLLALAFPLGMLTWQRNTVYRSDLTLWQDTVLKSPGSAIAQSSLGTACYQRNLLREALQHYRVSFGINPNLASIHHNLGLTLLALGHLPEAAIHFGESFRINPLFYPAHYQLGVTLILLGRPQEALPHFAQTLQLMPAIAEAQYQWGVALLKLGRTAEAAPHFREALRLKPDYVEADCDLGVALFQMNQAPEAVECFQRALRAKPQMADAHFNLGLALARIGWVDQAMSEYAETVRIDPRHMGAQLNLGIALAQAGKVSEALGHLEQAVQLAPGFADTHCNLGIALAEAGRLEEAVSQYREALRLRPDYAGAHYNLGNALIGLRQIPEAKAQFEEALRLDPQLAAARDMLNRVQMALPAGEPP